MRRNYVAGNRRNSGFRRAEFENPQTMLNFATGAYVRAGAATRFTSPTTIVQVATGQKRLDLRTNPAGTLIEGSRTNICLQSAAFDNATWVKTNCTVSANTTTAPDGIVAGDTIAVTASGIAATCSQVIAVTGNATFSVFVLRGSTSQTCSITVTDGIVTTNLDFTPTTSWTRVKVFVAGIAAGPATVTIRPHAFAGTGTALDDLIVWGAQLENNTFESSYLSTTGASVARSADGLTWATGVWPAALASRRFMFEFAPIVSSADLNGLTCLMSFAGAGTDEVRMTSSDQILIQVGGVAQITSGAITWSANQRIRLFVDQNAGALTIEGATTGNGRFTGAAWAWATTGTLRIGGRTGAGLESFARIQEPVVF